MHQIDNFEENGRGWIVHNLVYLDLHVAEFDSLPASSYIPMPKKFDKNGAYLNI